MVSGADYVVLSRESPNASLNSDRCRLLLVAPDAERRALRALIGVSLPDWEVVEAEGVDRARFAQRMDPCDVLMLDAEPARQTGALDWLDEIQPFPIALLTDDDADFLCATVENGVTHWLPRALALRHPALLTAVLRLAAQTGELHRRLRAADDELADCRRQVSRLVNRLWETVPSDLGTNWFTQRHMLERLQEEVARVKRHGGPLTVILGELLPEAREEEEMDDDLTTWTAEQVARWKRRSDVAGQYGPHGFMMVLPRTSAPGAFVFCERLRTLLEQDASPLRGPLRACFGVAAVDGEENTTITKLLRRAEERLEEAKESRAMS